MSYKWKIGKRVIQEILQGKRPEALSMTTTNRKIEGKAVQLNVAFRDPYGEVLSSVDFPFVHEGQTITIHSLEQGVKIQVTEV